MYGVSIAQLIEPKFLHVLGPQALHHFIEIVDIEVATVWQPTAAVAFTAKSAERTTRMTGPFASGRYMFYALVSNFELAFVDWRKRHGEIPASSKYLAK
jgi:hypothetical protein